MKKTNTESIYTLNLRPDKLRVKLKWFYQLNGNGTTGTPVFFQFSGNSVYDPDYAGGGTSANLWATMSLWYNKYMCTYSKCRTKFEIGTAGTLTYQFWGLMRTLNQAQPTSTSTLNAQPYSKYKQIQCLSGQTSNTSLNWQHKSSTPRMLGRKMDPSIDRVSVTSDPNEEWIYEYAIVTSSNANVNVMAHLIYWVEFSDRAAVPIS